jgi:hypothetical protein
MPRRDVSRETRRAGIGAQRHAFAFGDTRVRRHAATHDARECRVRACFRAPVRFEKSSQRRIGRGLAARTSAGQQRENRLWRSHQTETEAAAQHDVIVSADADFERIVRSN